MKKVELLYKDEVYRVIGAAMEVHSELGPGFLEGVYHEALEIVFDEKGIPYESHAALAIHFRNRILKKKYESDFLCFGSIVVEIKAAARLTSEDEAQLLNYLTITKYRVGVLINFGSQRTLEWRRLIK